MWGLNCLVYAGADVATQWTNKPKEKVSEHKPNTKPQISHQKGPVDANALTRVYR